jgi:hypothetical protein
MGGFKGPIKQTPGLREQSYRYRQSTDDSQSQIIRGSSFAVQVQRYNESGSPETICFVVATNSRILKNRNASQTA